MPTIKFFCYSTNTPLLSLREGAGLFLKKWFMIIHNVWPWSDIMPHGCQIIRLFGFNSQSLSSGPSFFLHHDTFICTLLKSLFSSPIIYAMFFIWRFLVLIPICIPSITTVKVASLYHLYHQHLLVVIKCLTCKSQSRWILSAKGDPSDLWEWPLPSYLLLNTGLKLKS